MPAPTNISAATATDLFPLPNTIVEDVSGAVAPAREVWFKYTAQIGEIQIGAWAFGALASTNYIPQITVWTGQLGSLTTDLNGDGNVTIIAIVNVPTTFPVNPGQTYYFQVVNSTGLSGAPETDLTFSALSAPTTASVPSGSLLVTDDQPDFPGAIVSATTGAVLRYVQVQGGSDFDAVLPSGIFLIDAPFDTPVETLNVYSPTFQLIVSVPTPFAPTDRHISAIVGNNAHLFYVGCIGAALNPSKVTTVSDAGVLGGTTWTPVGDLTAMAPSNDETILYYAIGTGTKLKAWDLVHNTGLADIASNAIVGKDILVLSDGTLLMSNSTTSVKHFAANGTVLHTYTFTDTVDRIARDAVDDTTFWIWFFEASDSSFSSFRRVRVSDGTVLTTLPDLPQYELGVYGPTLVTTTPIRFGTSNSCPLILMRQALVIIPPVITGITPACCGDSTVQTVVITGTGFQAGAQVTIEGSDCSAISNTIISVTSTAITIQVAFQSCATYAVTITNLDTGTSQEFPFTPQLCDEPCITLLDAQTDLAARLEDPNNVHWTIPELTRYIIEALRTYNAFTQFYRNRGFFQTFAATPFYDLPTEIPALRGYNVTDQELIADIEYALMEPPSPTVWTGTVQFTLTDVVRCLQQARDQFLRETGAVLTRSVTALFAIATDGRLTLSDRILTLRRVAWVMADGTVVPLHREDEWALTAYATRWPQNPIEPEDTFPTGYSVGVTPPEILQLAPVPVQPGQLDTVSVNLGPPFNFPVGTTPPTIVGSPLLINVPDDWAWVIKYKALGDLLSQAGVAFDPDRAAYCHARYQQGVKMAGMAAVVLAGRINNILTRLTSLSETDIYRRTWQTTPAAPTSLATAGQNLVAAAPLPSGQYTVTLDVVSNMPVPVFPSDCLEITQAIFEPILDLAEHIALFKEGPGQLQQAMGLFDRFHRSTGITVELDQGNVPYRGPILQQTQQDEREKSRRLPPEEGAQ